MSGPITPDRLLSWFDHGTNAKKMPLAMPIAKDHRSALILDDQRTRVQTARAAAQTMTATAAASNTGHTEILQPDAPVLR